MQELRHTLGLQVHCQMNNTFKDEKSGKTKCLRCRHNLKI